CALLEEGRERASAPTAISICRISNVPRRRLQPRHRHRLCAALGCPDSRGKEEFDSLIVIVFRRGRRRKRNLRVVTFELAFFIAVMQPPANRLGRSNTKN